ncbi:MAG: hypothetical protein U0325_20740 [Polyangiales bacterium]
MSAARWRAMVLLAVFGAGCGPAEPGDDNASVDLTLDSADSIELEGALLAPFMEAAAGASGPLALAEAARRGRELALTTYTPSSCVTAAAQDNTLTLTLAGCAGPLALRDVTGTLSATFTRGALRPAVTVRATGLRLNGAVLDTLSVMELDLTRLLVPLMRVTSTVTGVGARGVRIERQGVHAYRYERATQCVTTDGQWRDGLASATITNLRRCAGGCPEPGGAIRLERSGVGEVVTLSYPGGSTGLWRRTVGGVQRGSGTFRIACQN